MGKILQFGLFQRDDDYALMMVKGKWVRIPAWMWVEWELPGGIRAIIEQWQDGILFTYDQANAISWVERTGIQEIEHHALNNIHKQAIAGRKFLEGRKCDALTSLEKQAVDYEFQCMQRNPHLKGKFKFEWIAEKMSRQNRSTFGWRQVASILEEAGRVTAEYYDVLIQEKLIETLRIMPEVWQEAISGDFVAQAA